jgi:hypothetical protein
MNVKRHKSKKRYLHLIIINRRDKLEKKKKKQKIFIHFGIMNWLSFSHPLPFFAFKHTRMYMKAFECTTIVLQLIIDWNQFIFISFFLVISRASLAVEKTICIYTKRNKKSIFVWLSSLASIIRLDFCFFHFHFEIFHFTYNTAFVTTSALTSFSLIA